MKNMKKIFCILTAIAVMMTMSTVGTFAVQGIEGDNPAKEDILLNENPTDVEETSEESEESELTTTEEAVVITATPKDGAIDLSWPNIEGATVDGYYSIAVNGGDPEAVTVSIGYETTTVTIPELENYVEYTFIVYDNEPKPIGEEITAMPIGNDVVSGVVTRSGRKAIKVRWNGVPGVTKYTVYRSTSGSAFVKLSGTITENKVATSFAKAGTFEYIDKGLTEGKNYSYKVEIEGVPTSVSTVKTDQCVRSIYDYVYTKSKKTLTSHDGKNKKVTFKSGTRLKTYGFGGGKFQFYYNPKTKQYANKSEGSKSGYYYFTIARINTKKQKIEYTKSWNYSREEAELFVNAVNNAPKSKTGANAHYLWVSEYTQRLYYMTNTGGYWKCTADWNVSTGKASTPSPNGLSKKIQGKKAKRHSIPSWSKYQTWNSLHGVRSNWGKKLGTPQSSGCIRNSNANAKIIYKNCPKGTKLCIY